MRICEIDDCGGKHEAKGLCNKHYKRFKKHGDANICLNEVEVGFNNTSHPLYTTWCGMKERCNRKENIAFKYYGGRGIKVCDKWANSFQAFLADVGEKPSPKHTLDRIDNDGDYYPENFQWLTREGQVDKQGLRRDNKTGYKGVGVHKDGYVVKFKGKYLGFSKNLEAAVQILNKHKGAINAN